MKYNKGDKINVIYKDSVHGGIIQRKSIFFNRYKIKMFTLYEKDFIIWSNALFISK